MGTNESQTNNTVVPIEKLINALPKEELEAAVVKAAAAKRVLSEPLPGPLASAVAEQDSEVETSQGKVVLRPMVAYDVTLFKKLNAPHYRLILEQGNSEFKPEELHVDDEELYELIYQFTHPCKTVRELLKKGREKYRETATEEVADKFSFADFSKLLAGITDQINKAFTTMVGHEVVEDKKDPLEELGDKKKLTVTPMEKVGT